MEKIIGGKSKNTVKNYRSTLRKFVRITGKKIEEASIEDVQKFLEKLKKEMEPSSVTRHAYALKYFLRMVGKYDVASKIEIDYVQKLPPILSKEEIGRLMGAIGSIKEYIVFTLGYFLGMKEVKEVFSKLKSSKPLFEITLQSIDNNYDFPERTYRSR